MHIKIKNASLEFSASKMHQNLRTYLLMLFSFSTRKTFLENKTFKALDDISIDLIDGDRLGVIGANGSGKTTLLKLIAGIYAPMSGDVCVSGNITSFLSITNGSHPDLTGYETIKSQLLLLGLRDAAINELTPEIAEFSELGDFLHMPIKNYSSGMGMRLCFSIMTSINPEILIMDEWLSTGDLHFIEKAQKRISSVVDKARILVVASHDLKLLKNVCNKLLWIEHGKIKIIGDPALVIKSYTNSTKDQKYV